VGERRERERRGGERGEGEREVTQVRSKRKKGVRG
jgi:hypothetical protein